MDRHTLAPCRGAVRRTRPAIVTVALAFSLIASGLAGVALGAAAEPEPAPLAQVGRTPLPVATPAAPAQLTPVRATPTPTAVAPVSIPAADQQLRQAVATAMTEAARRAGVTIDAARLGYASRDDATIANAAVAGVEGLTREELERGAPVLFTYLRGAVADRPVPAGFYTVIVRTAPDTPAGGIAQLRNEAGAVVAEVPARITLEEPSPVARPRFECEVSIRIPPPEVDIRCRWGTAAVEFPE